jgi:putative oxidoreductase
MLPQLTAVGAGALLVLGLWTPVAGILLAIIAFLRAFSDVSDPWTFVLLVALGVGSAMVGPGAWSIDARRFGRKRIDLARRP